MKIIKIILEIGKRNTMNPLKIYQNIKKNTEKIFIIGQGKIHI